MLAERILAFNTSVTAACSPRELKLSKIMKSQRSVYVPNVAGELPTSLGATRPDPAPAARQTIVSVGRVTAARDPLFFRETVRTLQIKQVPVDAVWIGGGDDHYVRALEEAGVRVTGWLDRKQVLEELSRASLHIHTASWDAFPMVLLEANSERIPSLVRSIEAFSHIPDELTVASPSHMAEKITALLSDPSKRASALAAWDSALIENTRIVQGRRLKESYGLKI